MALIHISLRAGKPKSYRLAIFDALSRAMREMFHVPEGDQFITITEHDAANVRHGAAYLDIAGGDDLIFIQITANIGRSLDEKKALFRRIAKLLGQNPGIRPEDVFVSLVEVESASWSLGHGLGQYA